MGIGSPNPLLLATAASGGDPDPVTRSLRLDGSESLSRTFTSAGDSKKFTFACWVKRTELGGNQRIFQASNSNNDDFLRFNNDNTLGYWIYQNGSHNHQGNTTAVFRDVSAWMHVCYVVDTAQATAANRVKIFVNGVSHTLSVYPDQNRDCSVMNTAALHYIGRYGNSASEYANLYIADAYFLDGEAVEPVGNFIESNDYGGYKPKAYTGSFGTNGFHLDAQPAHDADLLISSVARNDGDTTFADAAAGHTITAIGDPEHSIAVGNPFTGDGRAVYFDGSSDYLTSTDAKDDANFDNSDWTLEFWINPSNTFGSAIESFMGCGGGYAGWNSSNGHSWTIFAYNVTNQIYFQWWNGSTHVNMAADDDLLPKNTWTHVAVVNQSGTKRFYIGGVQRDTDSNTKAAVSTPSTFNIGVSSALDGKLNGHLYDVSIQRGYCKYEDGTTFTPPTSKITADSNTEFLLQPEKDDSSFEDESSNGHTVSTQGSPTTIASSPYEAAAKSTAIHLDGSDALTIDDGSDLDFSSGVGTWEGWFNFTSIPSSANEILFGKIHTPNDGWYVGINSSGNLKWFDSVNGSSIDFTSKTLSTGTWYHVALCGEGSNTYRLYVDGAAVENSSGVSAISVSSSIDTNYDAMLGRGYHNYADYYIDGYVFDFRYQKGVDTSGAKPSAPFELNPVYIGGDQSGNKNHFEPTGISAAHDVLIDNPFKSHPTWNPLVKSSNTFSEGNLKVTTTSSTPAKIVSTIGASSGKWYAELLYTGQANYPLGVTADNQERDYLGSSDGSTSISFWTGTTGTSVYINSSSVSFSGSSTTWANGDIIGIALNADDKEVSLYKNGSLVGAAVSYSSYNWTEAFFAAGNYVSGLVYHANFGQDPTFSGGYTGTPASSEWAYSPPAGFKSLNSSNLDAPSVTPSEHFNTVLYNGSYDSYNSMGTATQSITGVGFAPDIVWIKDRDNQASNANSYYGHYWFDDVLGSGSAVNIDTEQGVSSGSLNSYYSGVSSFDSDGFSIDEAEETNFAYDSTFTYSDPDTFERYVAWCWKLGTTASSWSGSGQNPDSEQYNSDAGVSIIDYYDGGSGSSVTLNHSLGAAPEFAITLDYEGMQGGNYAWHKDLTAGYYLELSGNGSQASDSTYFPSSPATNTTFEVGSTLADGMQSHVALFRAVEGFSKFGSYEGNGSTDGAFIYTGFRPAFVLIKNIGASQDWFLLDNKREGHNVADDFLEPNTSNAEATASTNKADFTANGFKLRGSGSVTNQNNTSFVYAAFAESPFKHANAR